MPTTRLRLPPVPVFVTMTVAGEMAFMTFATVSSVYRITEAGLDPLQLILVGTVLEFTVFLAEVPTGVLADVYSRRLSLIVGFALVGIGFMLEGAVPMFAYILLAQIVWGIGFTFTSGATQAWLADEIRDDSETARVFVRAAKFESIGALVGIGLSVALATIYVGLSLIVGGAMFVLLAVFLSVSMTERGFTRTPASERGNWQSMARVLRTGLRAVSLNRVLMALVAIQLFFGMSSEPFDRLWAKHALDTFEFPRIAELDPVLWFGIVQALASIGGAVAIAAIERVLPIERSWGPRIVLSVANAVMIAATATFALAGEFRIAMGMVVVVYILHRVAEPFTAAWINRNCESEYRATVFSIHEQANSFGQVVFGPGIGLLATVRGLRTALVSVAILLAPPQLLYLVRGSERRWD